MSVAPSGAPLAGLGNPAPAGDGVHELIRERWGEPMPHAAESLQ